MLSIVTALTEVAQSNESTPNNTNEANPGSDAHSEISSVEDTVVTRYKEDEACPCLFIIEEI